MGKMKKSRALSVRTMITASLMIAIGLILPYVASHGIGIPGNILLPMHIPVLLCGFLCGPWYGAAVGAIIPVLSSLLTGMPPVFPVLPMMLAQLVAMGLISGLLNQRLKFRSAIFGRMLSIAVALITGLLAYAAMFNILICAGNENMGSFSIIATMIRGLPGIAIQLILIPLLVGRLQRIRTDEAKGSANKSRAMSRAKEMIKAGEFTCVVIKNDDIIHAAEGRGVSPLMRLYENEPEKLSGAMVADKIIGKAAAMLLVLGGATHVYGETMSAAGLSYLKNHGITAEYGRCVDMISNRTQTGICPIERSVMDTEDAHAGLASMKDAIRVLMERAI